MFEWSQRRDILFPKLVAAALSLVVSCAAALLATPGVAEAQFSFEGRVGVSYPTGELTEDPGLDQSTGVSFAADAFWLLAPRYAAYAGLSRQSFNCDGCTTDVDTFGFDAGVKFYLASGGFALPWVRGGLMLHSASVEGDSEDWGVGVDTGLGLDWRVSPRLSLVPAIRLHSYGSGPLSLTYFTADLGLQIHPER
jgi:hypothetical protein